MRLPSLPLIVFDTETTGFVPKVHRVIEFAAVTVDAKGRVANTYEQLFFTKQVPPHVEVLTHIKTSALQSQPTFEEKKAEIEKLFDNDYLLVGQNLGFDLGMMKGEGIDLTGRPWIDTSMLASLVFPELESYSLGYLSTALKLDHEPKHRALGDVRATTALLACAWERMLELPEKELETLREIFSKSSNGYLLLADALPKATATKKPSWLIKGTYEEPCDSRSPSTFDIPTPKDEVVLLEDSLDPSDLEGLIEAAIQDKKTTHWIAVKNLDAAIRRIPADIQEDKDFRIIHPAYQLLDPEAKKSLLAQKEFTADEATLAVKLHWYDPAQRKELPLHGGEEPVWNGKVAATIASDAYAKQFDKLPSTLLIDHRHLLSIIEDEDHPAHTSFDGKNHLIVDDASMLEDTATKAFGWECKLDDLRAASQGDELLTKLTDLFQLWIEKTRQYQDVRYLAPSDLESQEVKGLNKLMDEVMEKKKFPKQAERHLNSLKKMLETENLANRITWIEQWQDGSQVLNSVPERVGTLLQSLVFERFATTLIIPPKSAAMLPEIIPASIARHPIERGKTTHIPISVDTSLKLEAIFDDPPEGKTIALVPGRSTLEDLYVKYQEKLEAQGVTLICQGLSGGQGRMQAEFHAADRAIWLMTCWTFEGIDLPPNSVDQLFLRSLPFDHPSHTVLGRRALHYKDSFNDYLFPRLLHRLFRVLRTYARVRTKDGDVTVLDERIDTKGYGRKVREYFSQLSGTSDEVTERPIAAPKPVAKKKTSTKKSAEKKESDDQLKMF